MLKKQLLKNLKQDTYCRIGISKIQGVGVIAIKNIPKNVNPFKFSGDKFKKYQIVEVNEKEVNKLDKPVQKMVKDFFTNDDGFYDIPKEGLNSIDITFYMNHSNKNNINIVSEKNSDYMSFRTNKIIKKGDELTINYNDYKD